MTETLEIAAVGLSEHQSETVWTPGFGSLDGQLRKPNGKYGFALVCDSRESAEIAQRVARQNGNHADRPIKEMTITQACEWARKLEAVRLKCIRVHEVKGVDHLWEVAV